MKAKDLQNIPDVQADADSRKLAIDQVGVKAIRHPVRIMERTGEAQHTIASFNMYVGGLRDAIPKGGYIRDVAQRVLDKLPNYNLTNWQEVLETPPTQEELKKLGPKGIEALKG